MVYLEGNHGYLAPTPYYFRTNCDLSINDMNKLGLGNGRIRVRFYHYLKILMQEGYLAEEISQNDLFVNGNETYEKIEGSDGNY